MAGARDERVTDLFFVDQTTAGAPDEEGLVRLVDDDLVAYLDGEVVSLTAAAGGGITEPQHDDYDKLLHNLSEDFEGVPTRDADGVMTSVVARDQSDSPDIRAFDNLTVDGDGVITGYRVRQYNAAGSVVETATGSGDADSMQVTKS